MSFETDLHDLLERSADRFDPDPAVLADAERRAARMVRARRWARGLAAAAAAVTVAVVGVVLTVGPDPSPPVIGPGPTPSPTDTPTVPEETETTRPQETETTGPGDQQATSTTVAELGGMVGVAQPAGDGTRIELHQPDGTTSTIELPADLSGAWWFVDVEGGVVWQASDAGSSAVVRTTPDGDTTLVEAVTDDTAERYQLVGLADSGRRVLVEHRTGSDPDDMTADLLAVPLDGGTPEVLATEVGGWESGIIHAAADPEFRLYSLFAEASQYAVVERPDGSRTTVFEAGEPTGEYLNGVAITDARTGTVLVETAAGYPDLPRARLLVVDLATGQVTDEIDVPLQSGIDDTWNVPRELSHAGDHVLVNRYAEGDWLTPLVLDLDTRQWSVLDVTGRTRLGPAAVSFVSFDPDRGGVLSSEPRPDAPLGTAMVATDPEQLAELWQTFALTGEPPALDLARFVVIGTYLNVTVCPDRVDLGPIDQGYTQSRDSDGRLERVVLGVGRDIECQGDTTRRAVIYAFPDPAPELSITAPQTELNVTIP